jgi:hypothetical protein
MISHPLTLALLRSWMGEMIDAFSPRTQDHVLTLLAGTLLTPGRRTVAAALRVMGLGQAPTFTSYHRVLNRNTWSSRDLARRLLLRLLRTLVPPAAPVIVGLDDTLERRRGAKIAAKGIYRDPVRSSRSHFVKASGLRWLSLMLLAPVPFAKGCGTYTTWALPSPCSRPRNAITRSAAGVISRCSRGAARCCSSSGAGCPSTASSPSPTAASPRSSSSPPCAGTSP